MTVSVREATLADAEQLLAHVQRLIEEPDISIPLAPGEFNLTLEGEEQILADYAASDNAIFLVAEAAEQIVGALNCKGGSRRATHDAATVGMSVRKEWRNQGVGQALMVHAIEWARRTGIVTRIELNVYVRNTAAVHLYEKFGFAVEGRRRRAIYQDGKYLDDYLMALLL